MSIKQKEWSLNSSPIIVPISFQEREWNAIYVGLFLAEYSGSKVYTVHVLVDKELHPNKKEFLLRVQERAKELKVRHEYKEIEPLKKPISVETISRSLVSSAEELKAQAIVMSAHREGFFRELFGRISDHVARHTKKRVILVESPKEGLYIPDHPKRILIPVLGKPSQDPFIIAAALTSSASSPEVEMIVTKIIPLPQTLPLEAVTSKDLKREEKDFSLFTSLAISSLGRLFTPRLLPVRSVGDDVSSFAKENNIDLIIMYCSRRTGFYSFLTKDEYEIVRKSPCIVLVTLPEEI